MSIPVRLSLVLAAVATFVLVVFGSGIGFGSDRPSAESARKGRALAATFLRALEAGQYPRACSFLGAEFFRRNGVRNPRWCTASLRVAFMGVDVRYRIDRVTGDEARMTVYATVDGDPGRIVVARERGRLRVVALQGEPD